MPHGWDTSQPIALCDMRYPGLLYGKVNPSVLIGSGFLGRDFAIRTVSVETVISCVFFVFESRQTQKIGTQCVHVSAIWKFNDHVGKKAMQASRTKDICVLSP